MSVELHRTIGALSEDACRELFSAYGVSLEPRASLVSRPGLALASVIGFAGDGVQGACVLGSTAGPLLDSMPAGGTPYDWIRELANQLGGRIKAKLGALGITVHINTPVALRDTCVQLGPAKELCPQRVPSETVVVCVEVETTASFRRSAPAESLGTGEALFF